jgi:hypothetical protein
VPRLPRKETLHWRIDSADHSPKSQAATSVPGTTRVRADSMFHLTESETEMHKASNQIKNQNQVLSAPEFSCSALFQRNQRSLSSFRMNSYEKLSGPLTQLRHLPRASRTLK